MDRRQRLVDVSVVVATRDRWPALAVSLEHLSELPEKPHVYVVDNASSDGTPSLVRRLFPEVRVVALPRNIGSGARNVGARLADTSLVAFCDDDSWWEPGSLLYAKALFDDNPRLAALAARVLVGEEAEPDPVTVAMAAGPLGDSGRPEVTGFLACSVVVRRSAFLAAGGFEPAYIVGGEEELLALDLRASGWSLVFEAETTVRHHPQSGGVRPRRRRTQLANSLTTALNRLPAREVARRAAIALAQVARHPSDVSAIAATRRSFWVAGGRRPVPAEVWRPHLQDEVRFRSVLQGRVPSPEPQER
jgi:GT2 family glycosyltransferase